MSSPGNGWRRFRLARYTPRVAQAGRSKLLQTLTAGNKTLRTREAVTRLCRQCQQTESVSGCLALRQQLPINFLRPAHYALRSMTGPYHLTSRNSVPAARVGIGSECYYGSAQSRHVV